MDTGTWNSLQKEELKRGQVKQRRVQTKMQGFLSQKPSRCPVRLYQTFVEKRPPEMCTPTSPFYLAVNHRHTPTSYWYKKQPFMCHTSEQNHEGAGRKRWHSRKKNKPFCSQNNGPNPVLCKCPRFHNHAVIWT